MSAKYGKLILVITGFLFVNPAKAQNNNIPATSTGIVIVPKLDKPKSVPKFNSKELAGYLLVYFKDADQSAYMAISNDGYTFTDVNGGKPGKKDLFNFDW